MGFEDSKGAIARIHYINSDDIVGTGFLVADRYLLTCAHVVAEALFSSEPETGKTLSVQFYGADRPQGAEVVHVEYDPDRYGRDAAILYLPETPSASAHFLSIQGIQPLSKVPLQIFGYPDNDAAGRNITAETEGEVDGGWIQFCGPNVTGLTVQPGFSGAPVWSQSAVGTVGMVVARHQGDDTAKVGFMLPRSKLENALQAVQQHSLGQILAPHQDTLAALIANAYTVCRPQAWSRPRVTDLKDRLADLALMSANSLVNFAACLHNQIDNQPATAPVRADLLDWIERYKASSQTVGELLRHMQEQQQQVAPQRLTVFKPCLLVQVQADKATKQAPYQVSGWLIPNSSRYDPTTGEGYNATTGEGAVPLDASKWQEYAEDSDALETEAGIRHKHLPLFLATYIDQAAQQGIDRRDLTVEFFLPLPLINQAIEQCMIPAEFGFPEPLGVDTGCAHVVVRSQERLDFPRGLPRWEEKWTRLQQECTQAAMGALVDGDALSPKNLKAPLQTALGLRLTQKLPKATNQGEIGVLLATGTPIALWLRCHGCDIADQLHRLILDGCLEQIPDKVWVMRQQTSELEASDDAAASTALGHHLSFLWEDFYRVPPRMTYSDTKL